eukprot:SAG11_NODE_3386_length_2480_cov_6.249055_2_plen_65_part_00
MIFWGGWSRTPKLLLLTTHQYNVRNNFLVKNATPSLPTRRKCTFSRVIGSMMWVGDLVLARCEN